MSTRYPLVGLVAMMLLAACNACGANDAPVGHATPPEPATTALTPTTNAPGQGHCTRDADCVLVTTEDRDGTCCTICGARALARASAEEHAAWCREHWGSDHASHCPRLNCPTVEQHAACESGSCVAKPGSS